MGDGVTAAPVAVVVPAVRQHVGQLRVAGIGPGVGLADVRGAAAVGIEHGTAVLGVLNEAGPVASAGEVDAALVVRVLKRQHPHGVVGRRLGGLLKPHRHVIVGEVGGLGEAVAVVAGAGDVELHLRHRAQTGQIEFCPVQHDIVGAVAQVDGGLAGLLRTVVTGGHQLHPVVGADLGGEAVAVDVAVHGVADVVDVHVVNDPRRAVGKGQGRQLLRHVEGGAVHIAVVYREVVGAVVAAAHAADGGIRIGLIYRQLVSIVAVFAEIAGDIVGDGVTAAPVAVAAVAAAQTAGQLGVAGIGPGVGLLQRGEAAAIAVEHSAAILRVVDEAGPVASAGEVDAALVVRVLKRQHPQLVVRRLGRQCAHRQQGDCQDQRHQQGNQFPFHVIFLSRL